MMVYPDSKKNLGDEHHQDDLWNYIAEIYPFAWESCDSSDPACFTEFCAFMKGKTIGDDYGYSLICEYLKTETYYHNVLEYFMSYSKDDYVKACKEYLATEHKGSDWQHNEK